MSDEENDFDAGDAGSTDTIPCAAGSIKKGGYCMLKSFPCRVIEYSTAKPGKHGSAKATIVGVDIFTNKKYEDTAPTSANMRVPIVTKVQYEVVDIDSDFVSYIEESGQVNSTIKLHVEDEDLYDDLMKVWKEREDAQVLFSLQCACGKAKWVSGRTK